jgi:hypothetical protein
VSAAGIEVVQVAWVVDDLYPAMERWTRATGAGPFFVIPLSRVEDGRYRGQPCSVNVSLALGQLGSVQLELIHQLDDKPSPYRPSVTLGGAGFHHVGGFTSDLEATIDRFSEQAVEQVYSGHVGDMHFGYFDTRKTIGCMTEVFERRPQLERAFASVRAAAVGWDGTDPVRSYFDL